MFSFKLLVFGSKKVLRLSSLQQSFNRIILQWDYMYILYNNWISRHDKQLNFQVLRIMAKYCAIKINDKSLAFYNDKLSYDKESKFLKVRILK